MSLATSRQEGPQRPQNLSALGFSVGRPGLDPGTLGSDGARPSACAKIHLAWSDSSASPPTSAEILSNLGLGLHQWLHENSSRAVGTTQFENAVGDQFELRIQR